MREICILLIDNQQDWLTFAKNVLEDAGFCTVTASSLEEAQQQFAASLDDFPLILVDLNSVEENIALFQEFARTESSHKRPLVVLFPTELTPMNMSRIFRLGVFDCVNKQYGKQGILKLVEEQLADYHAEQEEPPPLPSGSESLNKSRRKRSIRNPPTGVSVRAQSSSGYLPAW